MVEFLQPGLFVIDVLVVAALAFVVVVEVGLCRHGLLETALGWLLSLIAIVVLSGELLSALGGLGWIGFCIVHGMALVVLLVFRRRTQRVPDAARRFLADWGEILGSRTTDAWIMWGFVLVIGFLAVLTTRAEPVVFDALTYRLSRIGQWLQDGRIHHFQTDDPRLNYMASAPDLVIAWLLGAANEGFRGVALSQVLGGCLLLGATFGLARTAGLSRRVSWGAVVIVLGMGNVAAQFTAVQSDLFTAGIFAASYLLWHRATERGEHSILGGIGFGLAWGSKGTMFYFAPGILLWLAWLGWIHRRHWRNLVPTAAIAAVAILVFAGPGYVRNFQSYGSPFGPTEAVQLHHGGPLILTEHAEKLRWNLRTSAAQAFDPTAQPFWLQEYSRKAGVFLAERESDADDRYLFLHFLPRKTLVLAVMEQTEPDADVVSCGLIAIVLFLGGVGAAAACIRTQAKARQILVWALGVGVYVVVLHALVQWHQWAYRFMVLAAPWMAVTGAWGLAKISGKLRLVLWTVVVASQLQVFAIIQWRTNQDAWQAIVRPERAIGYFVYRHWRDWAETLDRPEAPLRLAFPINRMVSAFYRLPSPRSVSLEKFSELPGGTAETASGDKAGWLLVPANRFKAQEGWVFGTTWLFNGDPESQYSVAAYRRLEPGEVPTPMVYRSSRSIESNRMVRHLTVKTWSATLRIRMNNPSGVPCQVVARTDGGVRRGFVLPSGDELILEIPVNSETLNDLTLEFEWKQLEGAGMNFPRVDFLP